MDHVDQVRRGLLIAAAASALLLAAGCSTESGSSSSAPSRSPSPTISAQPSPETSAITNDPQLQLLEHYEAETGVEWQMMYFVGFPENEVDARTQATEMAQTLKSWSRAGVSPLVIMEPTFNGGQDNMNLTAFGRGKYDHALNEYFGTLKDLGVTEDQLGTLVPFPEPNTPSWAGGVTDPGLFIHNTTKVADAYHQYFPDAKVSIMLDSQTFLPSPDPNWANGTMNPNALLQYVNFKAGTIDSFGLQGFTWDNKDDPSTFLSGQAAIACARQMGVTHVWFNTGTYSTVNNPNGEGIIMAGDARRAEVLRGVLAQAEDVQRAGLTVDFINIFGQDKLDKSANGSGTADYQYADRHELQTLKHFVDAAKAHDIPVTIFDAP